MSRESQRSCGDEDSSDASQKDIEAIQVCGKAQFAAQSDSAVWKHAQAGITVVRSPTVQKRANNCQPQPPLFAVLGKSAYNGTRPTGCWPVHALTRGWTWSNCFPLQPFADYLRQSNEGQTAAVVNEVIIKPDISKVR